MVEVPVGDALLGRVVNSLGQPIDGKGPVQTDKFRKIVLGEEKVKVDEPMKRHTTFRIGGPADYFLLPSSEDYKLQITRALIFAPFALLCKRAPIIWS